MYRFDRLTEKQDGKLENDAREEPKTKKSRLTNIISKIATLDNGTMVEAFKYLNYCQLAKNSLVSKRFLDVIRTHRHKLALLYVDSIRMGRRRNLFDMEPAVIKIFNKELSPEEYNEWVVRNNYSKQTSLKISTAVNPRNYELSAYGYYNDCNQVRTPVFYARAKELNHETWPLFQHFVRLLSDPFISIRDVKLTSQTEVFDLLASTIARSNRGSLQCEKLEFDFEGNSQKFFNWIKDHMRCVKFRIGVPNSSVNRDNQLLDFFSTASHCASEIVMYSHISTPVILDFVQIFLNLKHCNESQMIKLIRGNISRPSAKVLALIYEQFIVKRTNQYVDCLSAGVRTLAAPVTLFTGVCAHMDFQVSCLSAGVCALATLVRFFVCVAAHVCPQSAVIPANIRTLVALDQFPKRLKACIKANGGQFEED
ncbi:hypothetical protein Ddc_19298 [Ditylenchus destructor]|nr:hypothetical protein Ddc_19298 [Ditylenchus destructor]